MIIAYKDYALLVCNVTQDPTYREFDSGKAIMNISARYDYIPPKDGGRGENKYMTIKAWNPSDKPALMPIMYLQKGDTIWVAGKLLRDEYLSQKHGHDEFYLQADAIIPAECISTVTQLILSGQAAALLAGGNKLAELDEDEEDLPEEFKGKKT